MATFSPPPLPTSFSVRPHLTHNSSLSLPFKRPFLLLSTIPKSLPDNGAGVSASVAAVEDPASNQIENAVEVSAGSNGAAMATSAANAEVLSKFDDLRWIGGTWDLQQFAKDGTTDWDAVIDAEVRRRKWLQDNPETTSNEDPVVFDTSIIPWWAWMKRFHLPEAELLNGRAAMIGFFMAYLVDSLTGVGLVDQMGNFFSKTLLFVAVVGVLLIRKNEDLDNIKKLIEETTFYDKQWQATWQDDNNGSNSN
ncbi:hypothetical protein E1A91_A12G230100v1 [Gossypium mustelinum]|uniref:Lil3 protein n=1 Tax=Gossypium mustelinum TaxID=34275 RepID=A0A5D2WXJ9_GOSMU|nr:hypothetical protein E1A91_A12G230100v1 [Gossypium mustelinum]